MPPVGHRVAAFTHGPAQHRGGAVPTVVDGAAGGQGLTLAPDIKEQPIDRVDESSDYLLPRAPHKSDTLRDALDFTTLQHHQFA